MVCKLLTQDFIAKEERSSRPCPPCPRSQRSPAIVSLLPSPKEEAHWLFDKTAPISLGADDEESYEEMSMEENITVSIYKYRMGTLSVGILGEPYSQFNSITLTPVGADNEDEENEGADGDKAASEESEEMGADHTSRQLTAASQITTEALSEA